MKSKKTTFADLESRSCRNLLEEATNWSKGLSLLEAQKLHRHIKETELPTRSFKLAVVHSYTSDLLNPWLDLHAGVHGLDLNTYHAPYGMNILEAQQGSGLLQHQPELTLFMLQREDLHPKLKQPVTGLTHGEQEQLNVDIAKNLVSFISQFRQNISGRFMVTILPNRFAPESGLYDIQSEFSESSWWARTKQLLSETFAAHLESTTLLDLDMMLAEIGRPQFFDLRYWYTTRFPFSSLAANEFARHVINIADLITTPKAKVIVLDADNTLWGGVVGEEGMNGIDLGPDYPGNVFMDFQRRILDFKERGFILAICSKNNHQDVIEVLQDHPHQVLREEVFSALRINWEPKFLNIQSIAKELNLGLDSFIFVDDSDYECGMVRKELPQVQVIQTPKKATEIPFCLDQLSRLEILSLTQEDKKKTKLYAEERQRRDLLQQVDKQGGGIEEYLESLKMEMNVEVNSRDQISRLAQLTQKTNQFNLTTKRYSEQEIQAFIDSEKWLVASFSLTDSFGDSGVVGLLLIQFLDSETVNIDTLLMSCRVIGRKAESAFLETVIKHLMNLGVKSIEAEFFPTLKNKLVSDFYQNHQFSEVKQNCFVRSIDQKKALPASSFPMEIIVRSK